MRIKSNILTAVLLCLTIAVQARRVYIYGRVTDETGQPVELATVNEELTLHSAMTNLKGEYSFNVNTRTDTLNLIFRMVGHETRRRTLISPPDTVRLDILLPTSNYTLENVDINATRRQTNGMQQINAEGLRKQSRKKKRYRHLRIGFDHIIDPTDERFFFDFRKAVGHYKQLVSMRSCRIRR